MVSTITTKEIAYVLTGERQGDIILARMNWKSVGSEASVLFNGTRVLAREESHGDIVGFYHTHPEGFTQPSARDDSTMNAWSFCFGKPLLCAIATSQGVRAWLYGTTPGAPGRTEVGTVSMFKKKLLVVCLE